MRATPFTSIFRTAGSTLRLRSRRCNRGSANGRNRKRSSNAVSSGNTWIRFRRHRRAQSPIKKQETETKRVPQSALQRGATMGTAKKHPLPTTNAAPAAAPQAHAPATTKLTGSEIMWATLEGEGVDVVFGYPGGAILPAYDALRKFPIRH